MARRYWLVKSEPSVFSFADLKKAPKRITSWEGVRNYRARNLMRDEMKLGDGVLFYHSSADPPAVVGTATVARQAYPDSHQFDPESRYHDPDSKPEAPRWVMIDLRYDRELARPATLPELRASQRLRGMDLLKKGNRLSVQPVRPEEWREILRMGGLDPGAG